MSEDTPPGEGWARVEALLDELLDLPLADRDARLTVLASSDRALAEEVRSLLAAEAAAGDGFISGWQQTAEALVGEWADGEDDVPSGPSLEPRAEVGAWRVTGWLGTGGMGEVFEAVRADGAFEKTAALKLLRRGLDSERILRRFVAERRILARLDHPGVARLLDGGKAPDGRPYFVLEKVDGLPITAFCAARGSGVEERVRLVIELCDAVDAAHRRLIVHRDIKPSNVLVTAESRVKLLDFGIAKLLAPDEAGEGTRFDGRLLTPAYAAPEQVLGEPITTATDVYLIGALLYELLVGAGPHRRSALPMEKLTEEVRKETIERPSSAARRVLGDAASAAERRARRLRGDLDTILLRALHREADRRYPSAAALAADLRRHLEGRPVEARPDSATYRAAKFLRRHRLGVAAAALALAALLAALGAALHQARAVRVAARRAEAQSERAERIKEFVLSVFRQQDPLLRAQAQARPISEILADGVDRARTEVRHDPQLRAELLADLGTVQASLGDTERGRAAIEEGLGHQVSVLAKDDPRLAETRVALAGVLVAQSRTKEAGALLDEALPVLQRAPGREGSLARAESHRARLQLLAGDAAASLETSRSAVQHAERALGRDHPETALYVTHVGVALDYLDRLPEAEAATRDAVARLERSVGQEHARLVVPLGQLADLLRRQDRTGEAEALTTRALRVAAAQLGERHRFVGGLLKRQADLQRLTLKLGEALTTIDRALEILSPVGGMDLADARNIRGRILFDSGRAAEAAAIFERAAGDAEAVVGPTSAYTLSMRTWLGRSYVAAGDARRGATVLEGVVSRAGATAPQGAEAFLGRVRLAEARRRAGRPSEGTALVREALPLGARIYGSEQHPGLDNTRLELARCLAAEGSADARREAREILDALVVRARERAGSAPSPPDAAVLGERLLERGRLRLALRDRTAGRADLVEAAPLLSGSHGASHRLAREARDLLASAR